MQKNILRELLVFTLLGLGVGFLMTIVANSFVMGVEYSRQLRDTHSFLAFSIGSNNYSLTPILSLLFTAIIILWLKRLLGINSWAGPADSIYAAHNPTKPLNLKVGFASTLTAFICASGGASVGQYGPLVHFGGTIGAAFKRLFNSTLSQDIWLGCGVAAAISAGFNAPLAGVVFAHEAILRHFSLRAIVPIFIASVSANTFDYILFPSSQASFRLNIEPPPLTEIVPLLLLFAPLLALLATAFMMSIRFMQRFGSTLNKNHIPAPLVAALICGSVGVFLPEILGIGGHTMNNILSGSYTFTMLVLLLAGKFAMTALCLGFGLFGGIFSPSLFLGVAAGAVVGQVMVILGYPELAEMLSIAGMAAVSSAVVGAPIACIIIVMELTRSYDHAVISMLAVIICNLVAHRINKGSFFDRQLLDRGIEIHNGRDAILLAETTVDLFIKQEQIVLHQDCDGNTAYNLLNKHQVTEAYICDDNNVLIGKVTLFNAINAGKNRLDSLMDSNPLRFYHDESLSAAMEKASQFVGENIPVLHRETNKLLGIMTEGDLFHAVLEVQQQAKALEKN
jgi:CIC family chloride channel protein